MSGPGAAAAISEDLLLGGRVRLSQPVAGYRVAIDPVLLAAAVAPPPGGSVLDLGCGAAAAALCLLARRPDLAVTGIELQPEMAALARANGTLNGRAESFRVIEGDAADPALLGDRRFDAVMSNPPYLAARATQPSRRASRTLSHQESSLDLAGWIGVALGLLRPRGRLTLAQRADRLPEVLAALAGRAGAITVCPLWPRLGTPARRVLVAATKGSRAPARLLPGLVLHGAGQGYTPEAEAILRDAAPLDLAP
jgi:tRNA1(Val) A37 N6-methylase TrmN6